MEDSRRQPDISKSVQRFQLAIDEAKVRLDLAISPGTWLMPSDLQMNTESTVGYNNNLRKASADMKLGVNSVNQDMKRVGVGLMDGGESKIKRPSRHSSDNSSEKQDIEKQDLRQSPRSSDSHETLKASLLILVAVSAFLIYKLK